MSSIIVLHELYTLLAAKRVSIELYDSYWVQRAIDNDSSRRLPFENLSSDTEAVKQSPRKDARDS